MLLAATVAMATEGGDSPAAKMVTSTYVADIVRQGCKKSLIIDSRSFLEHNTNHITQAVNVCCSKLVKRRLQQNKVTVTDLLSMSCSVKLSRDLTVIVYDQCTVRPDSLADDCFLMVLLRKLTKAFNTVHLLRGGFLDFQATFPSLCETKSCCPASSTGNSSCGAGDGTSGAGSSTYRFPQLTSLSQPCLPVSNVGPTRILSYLYLGSQHDALTEETVKKNGITYILNVSTTCPKPAFIADEHFLRIPVNDNHCDKLQPFFSQAFTFLDKVREANGRVMVHCLAGISRSPTLAIAYVMTHLGLSTDEAYKYVKEKRPTISPNFNFMGQLLAYENHLKAERAANSSKSSNIVAENKQQQRLEQQQSPEESSTKKQCLQEVGVVVASTSNSRSGSTSLAVGSSSVPPMVPHGRSFKPFVFTAPHTHAASSIAAQSPTTALSKLTFASALQPSPLAEEPPAPVHVSASRIAGMVAATGGESLAPPSKFPSFPTTSLDQVVPIPCLTREAVAAASSSSNNSNNKRPLSSSRSEMSLSSVLKSEMSLPTMTQNTTCTTLKTRSPDLRAKRPHVQRPNSIAFSSFFELDTLHYQHRNNQQQQQQQSSSTSSSALVGSGLLSAGLDIESLTASSSSSPPGPPPSSSTTTTTHHAPLSSMSGGGGGLNGILEQQSRKSRSLEDILSTSDSVLVDETCSQGLLCRKRPPDSATSSSGMVGDQCRLGHHGEPVHHHQSNSSIGSSSSSIHGSLELIQVS